MRNYIAVFCGMLMAIGFICALGTVGACETEMISFNAFLVRSAVYMSVMMFGFFGLKLTDARD